LRRCVIQMRILSCRCYKTLVSLPLYNFLQVSRLIFRRYSQRIFPYPAYRNILIALSVYPVKLLIRSERSRMDLPQTQCAKSARDQSLATALYQRHAQAVFLYLRRHLLSREDAEDLLLEVFLSAVEKQTQLEFSEQRQRAWLLRVARYKLIDYHRQNTRRPRVSLDEQFTDTLQLLRPSWLGTETTGAESSASTSCVCMSHLCRAIIC
jgi:hypothetical protein